MPAVCVLRHVVLRMKFVCVHVCVLCACAPLACLLRRVGNPEMGTVHFLDGAPGVQKGFLGRQLICRRQKRAGLRAVEGLHSRGQASGLCAPHHAPGGGAPHSPWPLVRQAPLQARSAESLGPVHSAPDP